MTFPIFVEYRRPQDRVRGWSLEFFESDYLSDGKPFVILRTPDEDRHDGEWSTGNAESSSGECSVLELEPELDELIPDDVRDRLMRAAVEAGGGLLGDSFSRRLP